MIRTALLFLTTLACFGQATRTWVSGVGDDANPCSRTAPCKTFAGAISKTAAGGEISVLDPGGFGSVTITKSITLNGMGTLAGILASPSTNGIIINAAATDVIVLRNLSIKGFTSGGVGALDGIRILNAGAVIVDNVDIHDFGGKGINADGGAGVAITVRNSRISKTDTAIFIDSDVTGAYSVSVGGSLISNSVNGVYAKAGTVDITGSSLTKSTGTALITEGSAKIFAASSLLGLNSKVAAAANTSFIALSDNDIADNTLTYTCTETGVIRTASNNRKINSGTTGECAPTANITIQ